MDAESKEVCCRYDSDATEGNQDEKVGISWDYPTGVVGAREGNSGRRSPGEHGTDDRVRVKDASHHLVSQELLQNLGSQATGSRILRDLRHDIVEGFVGPRDITQTKIEEEIQLATILVRRGSIGVSQIRIHGDRDCVRHLRPPLPR